MAISKGDKLPSVIVHHMTEAGPGTITTDELFAGKKVVLFALPGAFTPTCSASHLPGYVANCDKIKDRGVDEIVCLSVNDPFVMAAWGRDQNADGIHMIADPMGTFTSTVGMELDLTERGIGMRSLRYSMVVVDGVVSAINVEPVPAKAETSGAEAMLDSL